MSSSAEFRYIVRVAGVDLPGDKAAAYALADIKGVGYSTAYAVLRKLGINPHRLLGTLSEEEVNKLSDALKSIEKLGLPSWMLNRRRDPQTGEDRHLITSDLLIAVRNDIELMKKIKCYKGIRHSLGLKVRGQRTRTTGRTGMTVGVRKRKPGQK